MPAAQRTILSVFIGAALAALLLHGLALLIDRRGPVNERIAAQRAKSKANKRTGKRRLTAAIFSKRPTRIAANSQAPRPTRRDPEKKKKKKKKDVTELKGQVVETARPENEQRPVKTKYLGRYDMKVEQEQKSKGHKRKGRELGKHVIDKPSRLQSPTSKSKAPTRIAATKRRASKRKAQKPKFTKAAGDAARLPGHKRSADGHKPRDGAGNLPGGGSPQPKGPRPSVVRGAHSELLLPATSAGNIAHNIQALAGNPGSDDYLPDVDKEGPTNLLNTRKFRYWDFFQRVRERIRSEWNPAGAWKSRDPTGRRYGVRDRLTVLRVRLEPNGSLKEVRVAKRSGLGFLDDEARRAFAAAGPYPNPPAGLLNERGEVEFQFGFMFEISSSRFSFHRGR